MTNKRILAVDDEKMLLTFLNDFLSSYGYSVTTCTDAFVALDMIKTNPGDFDLVITDQTMPTMTGLELVKKIRELKNNTPVILCSGVSDVINENEKKDFSVSCCLLKPVDNSLLLKHIEQSLS